MKRLLLLLMLCASSLYAAEKVTIEADSVETPEQSVYHAKGNVKVFHGDKTLLADEIFYDKTKGSIRAAGNVTMNDNGNIMECSDLIYNTENETGTFTDASAFLPPYNWVRAGKIDRLSPYKYKMEDVSFSTCEGSVPDWSFQASKADITAGGYLSAWHTTARIKDFPVLYAPYFIYPVKTDRETGFLVPNGGYNSRMGAYIQPRFFWDIGVDQDATFSSLVASGAPALHSIEHRYTPKKNSRVFSYAEYTDDERRKPSDQDGYTLQTEKGRYFLYNETLLSLRKNLFFRAHVDTVSDYEYLDDYGNYGLLSDYSNETDSFTTNAAVNYFWDYADFEVSYGDFMEYNVGAEYVKEHIYNAPHISIQKNITRFPVYFKYYASYDNVRYTRYGYQYASSTEASTDFSYDRQHAALELYKPFDLYIGTFTPSLKALHTKWYNMEGDLPFISEKDISGFASVKQNGDSLTRKTYVQEHTFKFNEIYKQYNKFRHSVYNTFTYRQVPNLDGASPFDYIYEDEVEWANEYEYTLSNYLTAGKWQAVLHNSQKYLLNRDDHRYDIFVSDFSLSTEPVKFRLKNEYDRYEKDTGYLYTRLNVNMNPFSFNASYTFDRDSYDTNDNNSVASLSASYTGTKYDVALSRTVSGVNATPKFDNMNDRHDTVSVTYKKDCWAFGISYIRETDAVTVDMYADDKVEHTVMFTISLRGLGEYKSSFNIDKEENSDEL